MSKKKKGKKKDSSDFKLDSAVTNGVWGVVFATIAIISILSFFEKAGALGDVINHSLRTVFGWGMYIAPFVLIAVAAGYVLSWGKKITNKYLLLAAFFFFSSILGFFTLTNIEQAVDRGGWWGYVFVWPFVQLLGGVGAFIALLAVAVISLIVGFNLHLDKTVMQMVEKRKAKKGAMEIEDTKTVGEDTGDKKDKKEEGLKVKSLGEDLDVKEASKKSKENDDEDKKSKKNKEADFVKDQGGMQFDNFELPPVKLLGEDGGKPTSGDITANANIIQRTLQNFGIDVEMGEVNVGPTVTQYTLKPAEGIKLSRITGLGSDLALALAAHPLRIEAPIPGRSLVGVEIPNQKTASVRLRSLIDSDDFYEDAGTLSVALGRDVRGNPVYADLAKMPHMLIAGSTGSGKTMSLNSLILSLLYKYPPQLLRLIMVDPKRVEFSAYSDIPHLLAPIVVDNNKAVNALKWVVGEMERRFEVLSEAKSRDISSYNKNRKIGDKNNPPLPYIVVVIDELADLMSSKGREVEALIVRVAQMARAVGIHLILATQRPSVEVITGLIKANITARVAFQVASQVDSRTVLDLSGAEKLLGKGDMLFLSPENSRPKRVQGALVEEKEVKQVVEHLVKQKSEAGIEEDEEMQNFDVPEKTAAQQAIDFDNVQEDGPGEEDELYEEARKLVVESQKASASFLQRRLKVGYARAARLIDLLEESGVVGPGEGAKPREVYVGGEEVSAGDDEEAEQHIQ